VKRIGVLSVAVLFFCGCTGQKPLVKPLAEAPKIHRVAVLPFEGAGGEAVAHEFIRQLVANGFEVSDHVQNVDAVVSGRVNAYQPGDKMMIVLGKTSTVDTSGQLAEVANPVISLNGSQVTAQAPAYGVPSAQLVATMARAEVGARLTPSGTTDALWADEYGYEGLDMAAVVQTTVDRLMKSLCARILPAIMTAPLKPAGGPPEKR
jgi:TolB-like protein